MNTFTILLGNLLLVFGMLFAVILLIMAYWRICDMFDLLIKRIKYRRSPEGRIHALVKQNTKMVQALRRYHVGGFIKEHKR